ncbi:chromosome segregation protein SMC [Roseivivax halodurans JCM 10272]|uniref:Chromosome partition protein Smc n=1 Tax=Roseivivax halodurans JCM 10272 TaxID=1449350 RepID=X7EJI0_9RHOB|nr:AAA family ATPase [Roseivivax halodurans]ETX15303.1 chromosome segregation protein SMC [Roseivivax halodurans JCM 10272]
MRFSRLRLTGFKSFVDPTDLLIQDGLTGVVGPNGCGKSNLLEGLRWVMGENRPTAMRGGGMEDVIFAGASSRPARNYAEVSLSIDNSDRVAPAGFNDTDHLDITRRITRDVGSAYRVNGKEVRARDVQMLFADASTGSHSPALVRQGQISELINAKPKSRRRVLEDAAGIGGLYQRRHEAELKLKNTEANLTRVDDVVEGLASQLSSLAKQARQAARYRAIGTDLRAAEGQLLYRRWRDADLARAAARAALREAVNAAAQAERAAREAATLRESREEALPPLREEEAIAVALLQRITVERDTLVAEEERARQAIEALKSQIARLVQDIEREGGLDRDAGETIAALEDEAQELAEAGDGHEDRLAEASEAAREAASVLEDREAALSEQTEDLARLSARHQSAHRALADAKKTAERSAAEAQKAAAAAQETESRRAEAEEARDAAEEQAEAAREAAAEAEEALTEAEAALADTQTREGEARAARSEAEGEASALRAERDALARLLDRDSSEGEQILDRLQVARGYEKALGAALADDLRAPEVAADGPSGWTVLPAYDVGQPLPDGATPLTDHVDVPAVLVRRMSQIGLVTASDGARLQPSLKPGQRLVSAEGDLWRWDGYRARAEDMPSAAALRLEQINRLSALKSETDAAEARLGAARDTHESLSSQLADLSLADKAAREARREADRRVAETARAASRAEADRDMAEGKLESARLAVTRTADEAADAREAVALAEDTVAELPDLDGARAELEDVRMTVEAARMTMMARRSAHDELRREGEARHARQQKVTKDLASWRHRLETARARTGELDARREEAEDQLETAAEKPEELAERREHLSAEIETAEERRRAAADTLAAAETALRETVAQERDTERLASEAREARARAEARAEAADEAVAAAAERIDEEQETTPEKLLERLDIDPDALDDAERIEAKVNQLKRQRDALGAVNLRAEEDAREVQEEHDQLVTEKTDLEEAVKTLRSGIASLNREGRERLLTAFEQVNTNFRLLFTHLFNGGEANLVMVESDDPLDAGLEIMCQPPGKKLQVLSLLSGGEQTLTALALIFAVFLANPAPICVLDEVDAPLDDANVTRFCDMLDEMCRQTDTRFLIITHHAVTMARMDRLFGVTMQEQGVSQLVSVDLKRAEKMVA